MREHAEERFTWHYLGQRRVYSMFTLSSAQPEDLLTRARELTQLLARTSLTTAAGPDGLDGHLLRWAALSARFMECLTTLVNFCWVFHVLPQAWRDANLLPLLKRGKPAGECGSYRPISITAIIMRRIERLAVERLRATVEQNLSPWQAGFRKNRSTRQQVLHLQHRVSEALRDPKGAPYPVVFLDIARAFDSVQREFLLLKLWRAGVRGDLLFFFNAFLTGRRFRLLTLDALGRWARTTAGVPQGAVCSPLLYALFIDDALPASARDAAFITLLGHLLFADDMALAPAVEADLASRHRQMQEALAHLGAWARRWGVRFSASKSGCVWFHRPRSKQARLEAKAAAQQLPPFVIPYVATAVADPAVARAVTLIACFFICVSCHYKLI